MTKKKENEREKQKKKKKRTTRQNRAKLSEKGFSFLHVLLHYVVHQVNPPENANFHTVSQKKYVF